MPELIAILLAVFLTAVWVVPTVISYFITRNKTIVELMGFTLGIWIVKLLIFSGLIFFISEFDFYNHTWLLVSIFIFTLASLSAEALYLYRRLKDIN